jgi:hypothetical protein
MWHVRVTIFCHGSAKTLHRCLFMDLLVAVINIKPLNVATETQEWVLFALLSNYGTLGIPVNNKNLLYVQVTVHRDNFRTKQPTRCIKYPKFILS